MTTSINSETIQGDWQISATYYTYSEVICYVDYEKNDHIEILDCVADIFYNKSRVLGSFHRLELGRLSTKAVDIGSPGEHAESYQGGWLINSHRPGFPLITEECSTKHQLFGKIMAELFAGADHIFALNPYVSQNN